jgi:hypothetical protein
MNRVRSALKSMQGILDYQVNEDERSLLITFEERVTTPTRIMAQLAAKGYQVAGQPEIPKQPPCP